MWYSVRAQLGVAVKGAETTLFWLFFFYNFEIKRKKNLYLKKKKKKKHLTSSPPLMDSPNYHSSFSSSP